MRVGSGWSLAALLIAATAASATDFARFTLTDVDPLAVCNDGTPGIFYFRAGTGSGATKWVVRLEGGGWCSDAVSCASRQATYPTLVSSASYGPVLLSGNVLGILSADPTANPFMYNYNHVSIPYCSSDSFLGNAGPNDTAQAGTYQFRGKRIVTAAVAKLLQQCNLTGATDLLLSGGSAGGVAVLNNAGTVQKLLAPSAPHLANFKALVDAGWFLDVSYSPTAVKSSTLRGIAMGMQANWAAAFDETCTTRYGALQAWMCFFGQYAWPFVPVPLLFHQFLADGTGMSYTLASSPQQAQNFTARLISTLTTPAAAMALPANQTVPAAAAAGSGVQSFLATSSQRPSVFAPAGTAHTVTDNPLFATDAIGAVPFSQVLDSWLRNLTSSVTFLDPTATAAAG